MLEMPAILAVLLAALAAIEAVAPVLAFLLSLPSSALAHLAEAAGAIESFGWQVSAFLSGLAALPVLLPRILFCSSRGNPVVYRGSSCNKVREGTELFGKKRAPDAEEPTQ